MGWQAEIDIQVRPVEVPHFDAKGEADALFAGLPVTFLLTSFYRDNLIHFGMGPRAASGPDEFSPVAGAQFAGAEALTVRWRAG